MSDPVKAIRDALAAGPAQWKADKYGNIKDQHGETVRMNGVSLPCGHVRADDSSHKNTAFVLACNPAAIAALLKELDALREFYEADEAMGKVLDEVSPGLSSVPTGHAERADAASKRRLLAVDRIAALTPSIGEP